MRESRGSFIQKVFCGRNILFQGVSILRCFVYLSVQLNYGLQFFLQGCLADVKFVDLLAEDTSIDNVENYRSTDGFLDLSEEFLMTPRYATRLARRRFKRSIIFHGRARKTRRKVNRLFTAPCRIPNQNTTISKVDQESTASQLTCSESGRRTQRNYRRRRVYIEKNLIGVGYVMILNLHVQTGCELEFARGNDQWK